MRQGGREGEPVEHLGDTLFGHIVILVFCPVASRNGALEALSDGFVAHDSLQAERGLVRIQVFFVLLLHLGDECAELLAVKALEQGASHFKTLLSVVVTVVLGRSAKPTRQQTVDHVADEVGLLQHAVRVSRNVRQQVVRQDSDREGQSLLLRVVEAGALLRDVVERLLSIANGLSLLKGGTQHLNHVSVIRIVDDQVLDGLI